MSEKENKKVMSIAIMPDLQVEVKKAAKRKGKSTSAFISDLVEQAVKLSPNDEPMVVGKPMDEDVTPVVLKVPQVLRSDPERLAAWLAAQSAGIVKAMTRKAPEA